MEGTVRDQRVSPARWFVPEKSHPWSVDEVEAGLASAHLSIQIGKLELDKGKVVLLGIG